jgi:hypothetical protein
MTDRITDTMEIKKIPCLHKENKNFCEKCGIVMRSDGVYIYFKNNTILNILNIAERNSTRQV